MKTDIAERLEKIGNEMQALAAELKHAAHILDLLEERGIIGPQVGAGSREVFYDKIPSAKKAKRTKAKKGKKA